MTQPKSIARPVLGLLLAWGPHLAWGVGSEKIRLNQTGFASQEQKVAIFVGSGATTASVVDSASGAQVLTGNLGAFSTWSESGESAALFDFSSVTKPGTYLVKIGSETSHPVRIQANPFSEVARATIKAFWYNRCSYALPSAQAGAWARPAGHPDVSVLVHASAATTKRPTNSTIKSPGGWYDAGDYGKYVVNSGISTWTLLRLQELHPGYFDTLRLGVPSHGGPRSDLADEALWNLRWMLSMQDPDDGGVYHKLSTAAFSGFVMPAQDNAARYVVQKSTAAALDLAATAASASRIFRGNAALPGFADSCLDAALDAWRWARAHPSTLFNQSTMNSKYSPSISTGEYGDSKVADEFAWAASELLLATGADSFAVAGNLSSRMGESANWGWPGCTDVAVLGWISLVSHPDLATASVKSILPNLKSKLLGVADSIRGYRAKNPYRIPQGGFWWGGNSTFANNGMLLWEAWRASGDSSYRTAAMDVLDYLLGRNATGYCFVTGLGAKSPRSPHHRPSGADGVAAPVPGFLVGGANGGQEDKSQCTYPTTLAARSYVDNQNCYAVNEVAINWNAPIAYLSGVLGAVTESRTASVARAPGDVPSLEIRREGRRIQALLDGQFPNRLRAATLDGRRLEGTPGGESATEIVFPRSGVYLVSANGPRGSTSTTVFVP